MCAIKRWKLLAVWSGLLLVAAVARADIAVVVNPANTFVLSIEELKDLFMGKKTKFSDSSPAKPIDQADGRAVRNDFYALLAGKDESDMKVYWSTLIFTGNGRPPKVLNDDSEVKQFVKTNAAGIGYIESKAVDSTIRVAYTIKQ